MNIPDLQASPILMETPRIVGIVLVKNEERYIKQILCNIHDFCDRIIVADNLSNDGTGEIILNIAAETNGKIEYQSISHPRESHGLIERYAGSATWIFAVDGDELYDPAGLIRMRQKIFEGYYDGCWLVLGNVLNCTGLNVEEQYARGYLAPPCRSMTKLYNFNAIESWDGPCPERLHGGSVLFKPGFSKSLRKEMYKEVGWEESVFRCLHLCFLQRSIEDIRGKDGFFIRKNISDMNAERFHERMLGSVLQFLGKNKMSQWKREKYMRGPLVKKDISSFLSIC